MTLVIRNVTMRYPGATQAALHDVSLVIQGNEFFTLLGPSGCGKTTLLRLIAGFEQPTQGEITLEGASLIGKMPYERPVNTVFQSYALFPHLTVAQNVAFGLTMRKKPRDEIEATVRTMLQLVRLEALATRKPHQLSGGQQQRVALARALATHPRVLLLDESLSALDRQLRGEMQVELKRLQRETAITFIFVTHDQEEALTMSDRMAVLHDGRVQQIATPAEVYARPHNRFVAGFIGEMNLMQAKLMAHPTAGMRLSLAEAGELDLPSGMPSAAAAGQALTVAIRPECLSLMSQQEVPADQAYLRGQIRDVLYLGSDTAYVVELAGQTPCRVREQNRNGREPRWQRGDPVALTAAAQALQLLQD